LEYRQWLDARIGLNLDSAPSRAVVTQELCVIVEREPPVFISTYSLRVVGGEEKRTIIGFGNFKGTFGVKAILNAKYSPLLAVKAGRTAAWKWVRYGDETKPIDCRRRPDTWL